MGKSSLAYGIAHALGLGEPLRWEINSQSTLKDGLYAYDAIGHFRATRSSEAAGKSRVSPEHYVTLGPLGTAFLPTEQPRVLLIDELDKASWDLPNSLLHIFEEGAFRIPELDEQGLHNKEGIAQVKVADSDDTSERVPIKSGRVRVKHHPVVVITSNGDREFSPAFYRRCVQLKMETLDSSVMAQVVATQLKDRVPEDLEEKLAQLKNVETDIVLQTLFAVSVGGDLEAVKKHLEKGRSR